MLTLEGVRPEHIGLYWSHVEGWIEQAIFDAGHCWTIEDVKRDLDNKILQLWIIWNSGEMRGCICTQIYDTPRGKTCAMPVVYCDDMAENIGVVVIIEEWAKSLSCERLQGEGRAGWERVLKPHGWKKITTQVEKVL